MRFWAVLVPWVLLAVDGCGDRSPPALWPEAPPPALAVPIGVEPAATTTGGQAPERSAPQRAEPPELAPPKSATPDSTDPAPTKPDPTEPAPKPTPAASAGSRPS